MIAPPAPPRFCPACAAPLETRAIDGLRRLACPDPQCGYVFWDNPVPVVAGVVEYGDSVILIQNQGWPPDWWGLVTGFLERGETPEQGVLREVREELGLEASLRRYIGSYSFFAKNQLILAFHLTAEGPITQGEELAAYKPVPIAKLKPWPGATGQALADWLAGRG